MKRAGLVFGARALLAIILLGGFACSATPGLNDQPMAEPGAWVPGQPHPAYPEARFLQAYAASDRSIEEARDRAREALAKSLRDALEARVVAWMSASDRRDLLSLVLRQSVTTEGLKPLRLGATHTDGVTYYALAVCERRALLTQLDESRDRRWQALGYGPREPRADDSPGGQDGAAPEQAEAAMPPAMRFRRQLQRFDETLRVCRDANLAELVRREPGEATSPPRPGALDAERRTRASGQSAFLKLDALHKALWKTVAGLSLAARGTSQWAQLGEFVPVAWRLEIRGREAVAPAPSAAPDPGAAAPAGPAPGATPDSDATPPAGPAPGATSDSDATPPAGPAPGATPDSDATPPAGPAPASPQAEASWPLANFPLTLDLVDGQFAWSGDARTDGRGQFVARPRLLAVATSGAAEMLIALDLAAFSKDARIALPAQSTRFVARVPTRGTTRLFVSTPRRGTSPALPWSALAVPLTARLVAAGYWVNASAPEGIAPTPALSLTPTLDVARRPLARGGLRVRVAGTLVLTLELPADRADPAALAGARRLIGRVPLRGVAERAPGTDAELLSDDFVLEQALASAADDAVMLRRLWRTLDQAFPAGLNRPR